MNYHHRRSRKRSWTQAKPEFTTNNVEKTELSSTHTWSQKGGDNKKQETDRIPTNNTKALDYELNENKIAQSSLNRMDNYLTEKPEIPTSTAPLMFPIPNQESASSNMMLPPPPPIWYPPLYPSSYGLDPLHFFIDLRVSGHIYDRKNGGKETVTSSPTTLTSDQLTETNSHEPTELINKDTFRQSRNASAFTVPIPSAKNLPMNLTKTDGEKETKILKFDVKSMGFDKDSNKTSTNYIMSNINNIYKQIDIDKEKSIKIESDVKEETEEEREKRVKDLRALIGLELVVDYMNHAKPIVGSGQHQQQLQNSEESSTDFESSDSPAVEVVAIHDDGSQEI